MDIRDRILTGSGGYVAGTLGSALVGPVIIGVGLVVAGSAASVEVLCAPKNHPDAVRRVEEASSEFLARSHVVFSDAEADARQIGNTSANTVRQVAGDVYDLSLIHI